MLYPWGGIQINRCQGTTKASSEPFSPLLLDQIAFCHLQMWSFILPHHQLVFAEVKNSKGMLNLGVCCVLVLFFCHCFVWQRTMEKWLPKGLVVVQLFSISRNPCHKAFIWGTLLKARNGSSSLPNTHAFTAMDNHLKALGDKCYVAKHCRKPMGLVFWHLSASKWTSGIKTWQGI